MSLFGLCEWTTGWRPDSTWWRPGGGGGGQRHWSMRWVVGTGAGAQKVAGGSVEMYFNV
jgi:hypothetical protein